MTKKYSFKAKVGNSEFFPKGFYYQKSYIVLVGCTILDNTIRRKVKIKDVEIVITEDELPTDSTP